MAWALIILIVLVCSVVLVLRIYTPKGKTPEGTSQTAAENEGEAGEGDGGE